MPVLILVILDDAFRLASIHASYHFADYVLILVILDDAFRPSRHCKHVCTHLRCVLILVILDDAFRQAAEAAKLAKLRS